MPCKDKSTTYLKSLGYNVVRHPRAGISPLGIIGRRKKAVSYLGHMQFLLSSPPSAFPAIQTDAAANVNGQQSDKLDLGIGLNILGNVIGAMGGNLGINASYTNADKVQFTFTDVDMDSVPLLQLGQAIRHAKVDVGNPFVEPYVNDGQLLLLTKVIKSNKISVSYEKESGAEAKVDVPVVKEIVGGDIEIKTSDSSSSNVTFEGPVQLAFGFAAYELVVDKTSGSMELKPTAAGQAIMAGDVSEDDFEPVELSEDALLDM